MMAPPADVNGTSGMTQAFTVIIADILSRRKKMQGFPVCWLPLESPDRSGGLVGLGSIFLRGRKSQEITHGDVPKKVIDLFVRLYKEGNIYRGAGAKPGDPGQWFLKTQNLAGPVIEAVQRGEIAVIPGRWSRQYLRWLNGIKDWRISRQSQNGCRIPAYFCSRCDRWTVAETMPEKCPACDSTTIEQAPEVMETWFAWILWPFSLTAPQDHRDNLADYFPVSLMAVGLDMFFSRMARLILMGLYRDKKISCREIFIHGTVRDESGRKMNISQGNVVDPLEMADQFGTDALRFTLALRAAPGMDISFSPKRVRGYKAFVNKIWNACRFVLANLQGDETGAVDFANITISDKWILHGLNNTVERVNDFMDKYRLDQAAHLLYHFIWHQYCDWYLEFSKNDTPNLDTRKTLKFTLLTLVRLLHPFMPFVTEEMYRKLEGNESEFLLTTKFPTFSGELVFPREYNDVEVVKKVTAAVRKIRAGNRVAPQRRLKVLLTTESTKEAAVLSGNINYFDCLTGSAGTEIAADFPPSAKGFKGACLNWEILLLLESEEERRGELARLHKELEKIEKQVKVLERKISSKGFIAKTPKAEAANFKRRLQAGIDRRDKIRATIDNLS